VKGDLHFEIFSKFMGGAVGRFLIRRFNFFVSSVMKKAMGDPAKLTIPVHQHYFRALEKPEERKGCWTFPKRIIESGDWLETLWSRQDRIREKPALICWGMKDIAFREKELNRWTNLFPDAKAVRYADAGHFVQEEKGPEMCPLIDAFLKTCGIGS
ncbi:MAG: alpha/beta fold hydrolase, partial [Nitrospirota bacterium]